MLFGNAYRSLEIPRRRLYDNISLDLDEMESIGVQLY
jgi:hypothetical protein